MDGRESGKMGEKLAAEYLIQNGYTVLKRNFSCRFGEVDIIACRKEYLVFAEVKTRKSTSYGEAREFVGFSKQQKIKKTAEYYLLCNQSALQPRFDVIEVYYSDSDGTTTIIQIENAFC